MATKMTYSEQLKHPNWQRKRLEILEASGFKCERCADADSTLHVHHKHYVKGRMAWEYEPDELASLCETCHSAEHKHGELLARVLASSDFDSVSPAHLAAGLAAGFAAAFGRLSGDVLEEAEAELGDMFYIGLFAGSLGLYRLADAARAKDFKEPSAIRQRALESTSRK